MNSWEITKPPFQMKIVEMTNLNTKMILTIQTLEKENANNSKELKDLRHQLLELEQSENHQEKHGGTNQVNWENNSRIRVIKNIQVLIIGGHNVNSTALLLKRLSDKNVDTNCSNHIFSLI